MARWNRTITGYRTISEAYEEGKIGAREAGTRMAALLRDQLADVLDLAPGEETADGIANNLNFDLTVLDFDDITDEDDFDSVLDNLYDWADENRVWIDPSE
jgi:hypothetical protein